MTAPYSKLLSALNPEQAEAVRTTEGPVLVLAGAGTGKTRVITYRIAHLLEKRVPAEAILAMTFTNKAAGEMRERIEHLVGKKVAGGLTVGTFHSFCLHTLRDYAHEMGWADGFTIADASDQLAVLKGCMRELHIPEARIKPADVQARISLGKNKLEDATRMLERAADDNDELVARTWLKYKEHLARSRRLDFDDLLVEMLRLLTDKKKVLDELQARYRYLLVDEYQDTNGVQYEIVRRLAGKNRNLCVVGDDDQSIYGWRGADVSKILAFSKHFPGAKTVTLETNYRSTNQVLNAANRLIEHNPTRHKKTLRSEFGDGEPLMAVMMRDENIESEKIVAEIKRLNGEGVSYSDFAILFRTATQARPFEVELRARQIPYVLVGGMSFFDRKEVRDVLAYLRLAANPKDESSLLRIINSPPRGVGKTTIDRVLEFATEQGISAADAFERAAEIEGINLKAVEAVENLRARLRHVRKEYPHGEDLVAFAQRIVEEVAYKDEVKRLYTEEAEFEKRWSGVEEVFDFAANYVKKRKRPGLVGFLNELSLSATDTDSADDASRRQAVTVMSLHASKGLEYPRVFLVGLEEGNLPHHKCTSGDGIEEERRLAYVGVTRAQRALTLSWCAERARGGQKIQRHPSRYLLEVQGKQPPTDWIPAGEGDPTGAKAKKKKAGRKKAARKKGARRGQS